MKTPRQIWTSLKTPVVEKSAPLIDRSPEKDVGRGQPWKPERKLNGFWPAQLLPEI